MFDTVPLTRNGPCACGSVSARRVASCGAMFSPHTWAKPRKKRCSGVKPSIVWCGLPCSECSYAARAIVAAYEHSLQGKPHQTIDGFTPEQRFFLGFAQVWGENIAPQEATRRALTDPHAQGPFRVNGTVSNMPAFAKAFGCNTGTKMVRAEDKRCAIW